MRTSTACQRCLMYLRPSESLLRPASYSTRLWRPAAPPAGLGRRSIVSVFHDSNNKEPPPTPSAMVRNNVPPASAMSSEGEVGSGVLAGDNTRVLLQPNNLFHPMNQSPSSEIRKRAELIKAIAFCPHPEHKHTSKSRRIKFTCPDCGVPTYCSQEHWAEDYDNHLLICDALREANEDDHDLRSGRFFPEFEYPGEQIEEQLINMTNWDTLLYTRNFSAINGDRQLRQVTKLLTYPLTVASFLHELSPYRLRNRLTSEGLRSLSGTCLPSNITCTS
jgi:splicing suppressor protein 51